MFDARSLFELYGLDLTDEELEQALIAVALQRNLPLIERKMPDGTWKPYGVGRIKTLRRFYKRLGMKPPVPLKNLRERWITQ